MHVVGARPNYMKIAPVFAELARRGGIEQLLVHTGQHYDYELKDAFFAQLPLPRPEVELEVGSGTHAAQTAAALVGLEEAFIELEPALVVVAGDVNSTLAGALAAVKLGIPVCHVEAGLRSFDWSMPEEHNRRLTDHVSQLLLTHSESANENLRREGISEHLVSFVGNTMIDSLLAALDEARQLAAWRTFSFDPGGYVLVTLHRPALVDSPALLAQTMAALATLSETLPVVFPMHPRTRARLEAERVELPGTIVLTPPLPYLTFVSLEAGAAAVVTDSGGVQEETTVLGVPCFTLRDNTERPVTVTHGTNVVIGLDPIGIATIPRQLEARHAPRCGPPLWDGRAGVRAADAVERLLLGRVTAPVTA